MSNDMPKQKYSIEKHGDGYALYYGRDNDHHGLNLCLLTEFDKSGENTRQMIVDALNTNIQQLIKEAEQRQLSDLKAKIFKGIHGCGDNSCHIEKPTGMATNGGCRCKENRARMGIILSRLNAILNAGGE